MMFKIFDNYCQLYIHFKKFTFFLILSFPLNSVYGDSYDYSYWSLLEVKIPCKIMG